MDDKLQIRYPFAAKAFAAQNAFYKAIRQQPPAQLLQARERVAELVDKHVNASLTQKEAFIIAAAITLDPPSGMKIYGDPAYGAALADVMSELLSSAQNPAAPLPASLAPLVTAVMIARMEQTMDDIEAGKVAVNAAAVKASMERAAVNDQICLPNLDNKALRDLYEQTQFAYLSVLETAAKKPPPQPPKKPPLPPHPKP